MDELAKVWDGYVRVFEIGGVDCTQGIGKGGFLKWSQVDDSVTVIVGLGGAGVFNFKPQGALKASATYLATSSTNTKLDALYEASRLVNGIAYPGNYSDPKGTGKVVAGAVAIVKRPDEDIDAEVGDTTWDFLLLDYLRVVGSR